MRAPAPLVTIDWQAFGDCVISTNWMEPIELERQLGLSHATAWRVWHGKPVGLVPFLRVCRAMKIPADKFLVER